MSDAPEKPPEPAPTAIGLFRDLLKLVGVIGGIVLGILLILVVMSIVANGVEYVGNGIQLVFSWMWPAWGYALADLILLAILSLKTPEGEYVFPQLWAAAGRAIARPAAYGFMTLSATLLVVNGFLLPARDSKVLIGRFELDLLWLSAKLPHFSGLELIAILLTLILVTWHAPKLTAVSGFLKLNKIAGTVAAALAVATSFSFFTSQPILGEMKQRTTDRVEAVWRMEKGDYNVAIDVFVAARVLNQAFKNLPGDPRQQFADLAGQVAAMPQLSDEARQALIKDIAWREIGSVVTEPGIHLPDRDEASPAELERNPQAVLEAQVAISSEARNRADSEMRKAVSGIVDEISGFAGGVVLDEFGKLIEEAIRDAAPEMSKGLRDYARKLADKKLEQWEEAPTKEVVDVVTAKLEEAAAADRGEANIVKRDAAVMVIREAERYSKMLERAHSGAPILGDESPDLAAEHARLYGEGFKALLKPVNSGEANSTALEQTLRDAKDSENSALNSVKAYEDSPGDFKKAGDEREGGPEGRPARPSAERGASRPEKK